MKSEHTCEKNRIVESVREIEIVQVKAPWLRLINVKTGCTIQMTNELSNKKNTND